MESKNIGYVAKLDHLQFLAAFTVIEYHADIWFRSIGAPPEWLPLPLFHRGYTGVALFMVISGMILAAITYEKEIDAVKSLSQPHPSDLPAVRLRRGARIFCHARSA